MPMTNSSPTPEYVNFTPRLFASLIDTVLSGIVLFWPLAQVLPLLFPEGLPSIVVATFIAKQDKEGLLGYLSGTGGGAYAAEQIGSFLLWGMVMVVFWHYRSATPGKILLKMKIVDADTFQEPTTWQYIKRFLGYIVSTLPCMLGFFWVKWDKRRQAFHDKIANTVVIKVN
jgi:uncharacterized RDD family membrane protein YckC